MILFPSDTRTLLIFAARYAMGRGSGALDDVTRLLAAHGACLHAEDVRGLRHEATETLRCARLPLAEYARSDLRAFVAWCDAELARRGGT